MIMIFSSIDTTHKLTILAFYQGSFINHNIVKKNACIDSIAKWKFMMKITDNTFTKQFHCFQ